MKNSFLCSFLILIFIPFFTVFAEQKPHRLDDIVVTATRDEVSLKETPANITIITQEDFLEQGARSLVDVLKNEPGVIATTMLNNPKFSTVDIRGFGPAAAQNVLFLIGGRRVNSIDMSGADLVQIPLEMIERVEVYRGPATVIYGDNAIAGVVNIILKKGEGTFRAKGGFNSGSYDLYNPYLTVSGAAKGFSYFITGSWSDTTGYRHNNDLRTRDLVGHFALDMGKHLTFDVKTGHHRDNYGMPGYLTYVDLKTGLYDRKDSKTPTDRAATEENFFDAVAIIRIDPEIILSLGGSSRNRHTSFHYDSSWGPWDSMRKTTTSGFTPKLTIKKNIVSLKNTFTAGIDYYHSQARGNDADSYASSTTKIAKTDTGFYLYDELSPIENLTIHGGYRYTTVRYKFSYDDHAGWIAPIRDRLKDAKSAYRFGINYLLGNQGNLFLTYATGFRYPTSDEYFSAWSTPPVNRNLKPQEVREINLGVRWNFIKDATVNVTLFSSRYKNEIFYNPLTYMNENYQRTKRDGIEAGFTYRLNDYLRFDLNYTYLRARFDGGPFGGNEIPLVPTHKFSTKVVGTYHGFTGAFTANYIGNRSILNDESGLYPKLPGVVTFDLNVLYRWKALGVYAGVKNLTGARYSEYGAVNNVTATRVFYPSAERQYVFGFEYAYEKL